MRTLRLAALALFAALPLAAQGRVPSSRPEGWRVRYDRANAVDSMLAFTTMSPGWHITTGSFAAILYQPATTATGRFKAETRIFLFAPGDHAEGYGMFIGGQHLDGAEQAYTYFLVRKDGRFMIRQRTGATTRDVVPWTANAAITAHPGGEGDVRNDLAVEAGADSVRFSVNGHVVHAASRQALPTDGQVGLRINHGLNVHVAKLEVTRQP